jgi:hypothetical protein
LEDVAVMKLRSWLAEQDAVIGSNQLDDVADFATKLLGATPLQPGRVRALAIASGLAASDLDLSWVEAEACHARWPRQRDRDAASSSIEQRETRALDRLAPALWDREADDDQVDDLLRLVAGIGLTRTRRMLLPPSSTLLCVHVARDPRHQASGLVGALPIGSGHR